MPACSPANSRRSTARLAAAQRSSREARPRRALLRNPLIYDPDGEEGEKLEAWRRAATEVQSDSPLLAAALLWDAWETEPAARTAGLARPAAGFGDAAGAAENAGASGVCEFCAALRPARDNAARRTGRARLAAFLEAIVAGAEAGMKDHDRWLLARKQLEGKLKGRRSSSKLARFGRVHPGAADRLRRHDRRRARGDAARRANHGRRAGPPRDDRARPLSGLGNLVTIFCPSSVRPGPTAPGHHPSRSWRGADHPRASGRHPSRSW